MYDLLQEGFGAGISRRAALRRLAGVLGGIATAPLASALFSGCATPPDAPEAYAFRTLGADQQRTLAALVDRIIPPTDTPGAADAGVPRFIDMMLTDWYAPEERDAFLAGLADVDRRALGAGAAAFADLGEREQEALVAALDAEAFADEPAEGGVDEDVAAAARQGTFDAEQEENLEVAGTQGALGEAMADSSRRDPAAEPPPDAPPFFRQLKELTLAGYYTSEVGATEELRWNAAPGRYDADVPFSEVGRAWA